jgi:hypothetical protein
MEREPWFPFAEVKAVAEDGYPPGHADDAAAAFGTSSRNIRAMQVRNKEGDDD